MSNAVENETPVENEAVETQEAVSETPTETPTEAVSETNEADDKRRQVPEPEFITVCEEVALKGGGAKEIGARLGLKPDSVLQRRAAINKKYRDAGVDIKLTDLPRGGGKRKVTALDSAETLRRIRARLQHEKEQAEQEAKEDSQQGEA